MGRIAHTLAVAWLPCVLLLSLTPPVSAQPLIGDLTSQIHDILGSSSHGRTLRDLEFARVDGNPLRLDLFLPQGAASQPTTQPTVRLPVIVWIHGGGWSMGSRDFPPTRFLVESGFAVASIDYRLSGQDHYPAQIHDCKAAIRWLRGNADRYGLDAEHIGVWGISAGGHLAALLGTTGDVKALEGSEGDDLGQSSRVQAVCDFFGPTVLSVVLGHDRDPQADIVWQLMGPPADTLTERLRSASPVRFVTPASAPFLILHGDRDTLVPPLQSEYLASALKRAGVEVTYKLVRGGGHNTPDFYAPQYQRLVLGFFDRHLKPTPRPVAARTPR